jgi:CRP-like cAMP-binding protein
MQSTLTTGSMLYAFNRRDLIPLRPNTLWLLKQGAVRTLTWNEQGILVTLGYWGPQDVVGLPLSQAHPYQIECLTEVEAVAFPVHQWHQLIHEICRHVQQTETLLCLVRSEKIPSRLQQFLLWLSQKFGRQIEQGRLIDLRLTHQELAEAIGTSRVTVTRLLNQFEREKFITRLHRHLIVLHDHL